MEDKELLRRIVGNYLRRKRYEIDVSIEELAYQADVNDKYLGEAERGKKLPSLHMLIKLSYHLDVPWELLDVIKKEMK